MVKVACVVVCMGVLFGQAGCSAAQKAKERVLGPDSTYLKKVGFAGVENRTFIRTQAMDGYAVALTQNFTELLKMEGALRILDPDILAVLSSSSAGPQNLPVLMETGRRWGLNAVVRADISELTFKQRKFGIYGFREERPVLQLLFQAQVIDVETGTVIYQQSQDNTLEISARYTSLADYLTAEQAPPPELMEKVLRNQAARVQDTIRRQPWKSYIVNVTGESIEIGSGTEVGLHGGIILDVLRSGSPLTNYLGQKFLPPGKHIGRVELIGCEEHFCTAKALEDLSVQHGDVVTLSN